MQSDPTIAFRNVDHSPAIEALIRTRIAELERFSDQIVGCDVVVEAETKRKVHARGFHVRVTLRVPGPDISVDREVSQGDAQDDLKLAVNKTFSAAETVLKEHMRKLKAQEVKHHPPILHGEITTLEPELGYGYVTADDGREVYFQRDSLETGAWEDLSLGAKLRFREMQGEKGPYAANVAAAG